MNIFEKENLKILITDSGIGGFSVASILHDILIKNKSYNNVDIVYCDARENKSFRYNEIADIEERIKIFSNRLKSLNEIFKPDVIFIACNTLSILYNKTDFYKQAKIPVIDIFDAGVKAMVKYLTINSENNLFILGTRTTINDNNYKKELVGLGFEENRIINQMCPSLSKYIEISCNDDYDLNPNIEWLVNRMIEKKHQNWNNFSISLNCTHYIYVVDKFLNFFKDKGFEPSFICPNIDMCDIFNKYQFKNRFSSTNIDFKICNNFDYNENGMRRLYNYYYVRNNPFFKNFL